MMDLLNEVPITLVVKAPNQKVADQTVECALNWTVKKLKEHLARVYPSNPTENQQRIIYSGKLLQDDVTLKDVLREHGSNETVHTVHLVCSNSSTDVSASQSLSDLSVSPVSSTTDGLRNRRAPTSDLRQQQDNDAQLPLQHQPPTEPSSAAPSSGAERLQFPASAFHPSQYNTYMSSYLPPGVVGMAATLPSGISYTADQHRWLQQQQQAYAQYISSYMQFFQQGAMAMGQPFDYTIPPLTAPPVPTNAAQAPPADAVAPPAQPQQPQVVRMNAQGGLVNDDDDDEEVNRDWLDWFYVGVRLSLLMCILFFYSTPVRFLATISLILFMFCFQMGWARIVGQRRQPAQAPAPPVNAPPAAEANAAPAAAEEDPNGNDTPGDQGASAPEEQRRPRGLSFAWSVFLSFFASLAPQPPQPVNAN